MKTCTCPKPYPIWQLAPCNEDGWTCGGCANKLPGEPPGFSPQLDRSNIEDKVGAILMELHENKLIYVSNSSEGDSIAGTVAVRCRDTFRFDQYSIISFIMDYLSSHGDYWMKLSEGVMSGNDKRDRCKCGKLATSYVGSKDGWTHYCNECYKEANALHSTN